MKGQLKASTPAKYIGQLTEPRLTEIGALDAVIRETAPQLEPFIHAGMLAYGPWHYKYATGRNKNYISLYIAAGDEAGYVPERYKDCSPQSQHWKRLHSHQAAQRGGSDGTAPAVRGSCNARSKGLNLLVTVRK